MAPWWSNKIILVTLVLQTICSLSFCQSFRDVRTITSDEGVLLFASCMDKEYNLTVVGRYTKDVDVSLDSSPHVLTPDDTLNFFIANYDSTLSLNWAGEIGSAGGIVIKDVAPGVDGAIYVAGSYTDTIDFDPTSGVEIYYTDNHESYGFVMKLDSTGELEWFRDFAPQLFMDVLRVSSDSIGNVFLGGNFYGHIDFDPGPDTVSMAGMGSSYAVFFVKLDSAGDFEWANMAHGNSPQYLQDMEVDRFGNLLATGTTSGEAFFFPGPTEYHDNHSDAAAYTLHASGSGDLNWAIVTPVDSGFMYPFTVDVDHDGLVYATGTYKGAIDLDPTSAVYSLTSYDHVSTYFHKLKSNGDFANGLNFDGPKSLRIYDVALDGDNRIRLAGVVLDSSDVDPFGGVTLVSVQGSGDGYVAAHQKNGKYFWSRQLASDVNAAAKFLHWGSDSTLIAVGDFTSSCNFDPGITDSTLISTQQTKDIFIYRVRNLNTVDREDVLHDDRIIWYPNPAMRSAAIQVKGLRSLPFNVEVLDAQGRLLSVQKIRETGQSLQLDEFPAGLYFLQVRIGDIHDVQKLILY